MQSLRIKRTVAAGWALAVAVVLAATLATAALSAHGAKVTAAFASPRLYKTDAAVTYDWMSVPRGSRVQVVERPSGKGGDAGDVSVVTLSVWGLKPKRRYDAYVYMHRCGTTPAAAGRRLLNGPSAGYYPQNEVVLSFETDGRGNATSESRQYWMFDLGRGNSVVILSCGSKFRLACVTVPLT